MVAPAIEPSMDLLFVGEEREELPFSAFQRIGSRDVCASSSS